MNAAVLNRRSSRHAIRNRLVLSMSATVALGLVMTGIVFAAAAGTIRTESDETTRMDALDESVHALQVSLFTQETFVFDHALSGRDEAIQEFDAATSDATEAYARLRTLAAPFPDILATATTAHDAGARWRESFATPFLRRAATAGVADGTAAVEESEVLFLPAEEGLEALNAALTAQRAAIQDQIATSIPRLATVIVPLGLSVTFLLAVVGIWLARSISSPLGRLNRTVEALVRGEQITFRAERDDEIGALAEALEQLRVDAGDRYDLARLEGQHAAVFNQLAELTSFAREEGDLVRAASLAIRRLVETSGGDVLLANPSQNRLTVGVAWGDGAPEAGSLVNLERIDRCPGIRRSSAFVAPDVADDMAVRCPAHPSEAGTLACVPMLALGKVVGVIHLRAPAPNALEPETIALVTRVAENVGLAMANARLMNTMEGQAMTDSLTGLRNTRFFDPYLEQELEAARRDGQQLSVLMVDLDHFKAFNDTHGHPAGDEALRAFARTVRGSIRASDVAARYGGEEFIVALRHTGIEEATSVAEKIRASIEQMVVELGPGRYARISASFGVATSGPTVVDTKSLVSLADAALYRAKGLGRNRVEVHQPTTDVVDLTTAGRRRLGKAARALSAVDPAAG